MLKKQVVKRVIKERKVRARNPIIIKVKARKEEVIEEEPEEEIQEEPVEEIVEEPVEEIVDEPKKKAKKTKNIDNNEQNAE